MAVFNKKIVASNELPDDKDKPLDLIADIRYYKPEDSFDINKYIPKL
jgi:hypothetical protein